jgi:hypothetical protein
LPLELRNYLLPRVASETMKPISALSRGALSRNVTGFFANRCIDRDMNRSDSRPIRAFAASVFSFCAGSANGSQPSCPRLPRQKPRWRFSHRPMRTM